MENIYPCFLAKPSHALPSNQENPVTIYTYLYLFMYWEAWSLSNLLMKELEYFSLKKLLKKTWQHGNTEKVSVVVLKFLVYDLIWLFLCTNEPQSTNY